MSQTPDRVQNFTFTRQELIKLAKELQAKTHDIISHVRFCELLVDSLEEPNAQPEL